MLIHCMPAIAFKRSTDRSTKEDGVALFPEIDAPDRSKSLFWNNGIVSRKHETEKRDFSIIIFQIVDIASANAFERASFAIVDAVVCPSNARSGVGKAD